MTVEQKDLIRFRFRVAAYVYFAVALLMAFILTWFQKDVTAFGVVVGALSLPIGGVLVFDMKTVPGVSK